MGNLCQTKGIQKEAIYYYKLVNSVTAETTVEKQKVKLTVSLSDIPDSSQRKVSLLNYQDKSRLAFKIQGETDFQSKNCNGILF